MPMQPDIAELKRIRDDEEWSYERLAREIGTITTAAVYRLLQGETQPSERTQKRVRAFVVSRKDEKKSRRVSA